MKILSILTVLALTACGGHKDGTISTSEGMKPPAVCKGEGCP